MTRTAGTINQKVLCVSARKSCGSCKDNNNEPFDASSITGHPSNTWYPQVTFKSKVILFIPWNCLSPLMCLPFNLIFSPLVCLRIKNKKVSLSDQDHESISIPNLRRQQTLQRPMYKCYPINGIGYKMDGSLSGVEYRSPYGTTNYNDNIRAQAYPIWLGND